MYELFKTWWRSNEYPENQKPSTHKFTKSLSALGFKKEQLRPTGGKSAPHWIGVKVRSGKGKNILTFPSGGINLQTEK
jgi:hypothetical protein